MSTNTDDSYYTNRSPSGANPASLLLENQNLIERNQNLELKLRYVQSVNTIFRQRVGMLMQALSTRLVEMQTATNMDANLQSIFAAVDESAVAQLPGINPEVAYWQDRFIDAMSNIQPISQNEVETLCRLIREKVNRDAVVNTDGSSPNRAAVGGDCTSPGSPAAGRSSSYAQQVAAEVADLREQLRVSEARNKSLFHRVTELRKRESDKQNDTNDNSVSLIHEVADLTGTMRELRARLSEQEVLNRRLTQEVNVLRSDKNLQMQHLSRMQGVCAAVMRESQCAVNEGLAATQMNETALLKRQMDTFELVLRKTEADLTAAKRHLEERDQQLGEKERECQGLQMRMDAKEKTVELYRARCEALATQEKDQREEATKSIESIRGRLSEAVGELEGAFTTKSLSSGLENISSQSEKFAVFRTQMDDLQKQYDELRGHFQALSEELNLCAKQNRVPRTEAIAADTARVVVGDIKYPREAVLRSDGVWKEVRDLNEGSVFYVTTAIKGTPFDPEPGLSSSSSPPPSPTTKKLDPPPAQQQQQPQKGKSPSPAPADDAGNNAAKDQQQQQPAADAGDADADAAAAAASTDDTPKSPSKPTAENNDAGAGGDNNNDDANKETSGGDASADDADKKDEDGEKPGTPTAAANTAAAADNNKDDDAPAAAAAAADDSGAATTAGGDEGDELDKAVAAALASGEWKEVKDKNGRTYFYHPASKRTTWDLKKELKKCMHAAEGE